MIAVTIPAAHKARRWQDENEKKRTQVAVQRMEGIAPGTSAQTVGTRALPAEAEARVNRIAGAEPGLDLNTAQTDNALARAKEEGASTLAAERSINDSRARLAGGLEDINARDSQAAMTKAQFNAIVNPVLAASPETLASQAAGVQPGWASRGAQARAAQLESAANVTRPQEAPVVTPANQGLFSPELYGQVATHDAAARQAALDNMVGNVPYTRMPSVGGGIAIIGNLPESEAIARRRAMGGDVSRSVPSATAYNAALAGEQAPGLALRGAQAEVGGMEAETQQQQALAGVAPRMAGAAATGAEAQATQAGAVSAAVASMPPERLAAVMMAGSQPTEAEKGVILADMGAKVAQIPSGPARDYAMSILASLAAGRPIQLDRRWWSWLFGPEYVERQPAAQPQPQAQPSGFGGSLRGPWG